MPLVSTEVRLDIPPHILEDILSIHVAFDADSGHFVCHSLPLRLVVARGRSALIPLIQLSSCTLITLGEENSRVIAEESEKEAELTLKSPEILEAGGVRVFNKEALEILSGISTQQMRVYVISLDNSKGIAIVTRGEAGVISIIALNCEEARRREVMHV